MLEACVGVVSALGYTLRSDWRMIVAIARLVTAAIAGSMASLLGFVMFMLTVSAFRNMEHVSAVNAAPYAAFFVFFFAGLPVLGVAIFVGIPLALLLRNTSRGDARTIFLAAGTTAGAIAGVVGWHLIWNGFDLVLTLPGAAVGLLGAYTFWRIAEAGAPDANA